MTGTNIANNNGWEGLRIETNGTVCLDQSGGFLQRLPRWRLLRFMCVLLPHGIGKAVTLTNVKALHNCANGITLDVNGITTFNNVRAWLNGDWGLGSGSGVYMDTHGYAINLLNCLLVHAATQIPGLPIIRMVRHGHP